MNLFTKMRNEKIEAKFQPVRVQRAVLDGVVQFTKQAVLPDNSTAVHVNLIDTAELGGKGKVPYYLLVWAGSGEENWINVGYAAGQASTYLRFQGIFSQIIREAPEWLVRAVPDMGKCMAAVAFGFAEESFQKNENEWPERPCICRDSQDGWTEEVLSVAIEHFMMPRSAVRVVRKNNRLYLGTRSSAGKKAEKYRLELGIAAANIMAAADELWIDLEIERIDDPRMPVSIYRRQERESRQSAGRLEEAAERFSGRLKGKKRRWRYA